MIVPTVYPYVCPQCHSNFSSPYKTSKFCSHDCHSASRRTGTILKGYRRVRGDNGTQVYEHRLVLERHLNRKLTPFEVVHHKDGDKLNNALSNLEVFSSQSDHIQEHRHTFSSAIERQCSKCGEIKPVGAFYLRNDRPDGLHSRCKECTRKTPNGSRTHRFRSETHKQCSRCEEIKPRTEFYRRGDTSRDPHLPHCILCQKTTDRLKWLGSR